MQLVQANGTGFILSFFDQVERMLRRDQRPATVTSMYKPRGNIMGLLLTEYDDTFNVHAVVYVIIVPHKPERFAVYMSAQGNNSHEHDECGNHMFTFMDGTKVFEYQFEELGDACADIVEFFKTEQTPALKRDFTAIVNDHQYYTV